MKYILRTRYIKNTRYKKTNTTIIIIRRRIRRRKNKIKGEQKMNIKE